MKPERKTKCKISLAVFTLILMGGQLTFVLQAGWENENSSGISLVINSAWGLIPILFALVFISFEGPASEHLHNTTMSYDATIIGSGPNGLAAAVRLAQEGLSVLVVEGHETVGVGRALEN